MSSSSIGYPARRRSTRYQLAAALVALVVGALVLSSFIDFTAFRGLPLGSGLFALPAAILIVIATYFGLRGLEVGSDRRRRHLAIAGGLVVTALLLWLLVLNAYEFSASAGPWTVLVAALACLPTTAFGLWVVKQLDLNEKEPWRLVLVAVLWGALVATSLVIVVETLWDGLSFRLLVPGPGLDASIAFSAGVFEELAKGLAVLLLFLLMRNEFDDVVDGIVYGAAVGLGFNFMESISYMTYLYALYGHGQGAVAAGFQWYARQILGLFFGHATYTALVGAGIGIARQSLQRRQAVIAILAGWIVAIAAHFSWDAWIEFFPISNNALALIQIHLRTLLMTGPFTAGVVALLVLGLEREGRAIREELEMEARSGRGAVLPVEVPVLSGPWRRLRSRLALALRQGVPGYVRLARLQQAQIELAMQGWHRRRGESELPREADEELRAVIQRRRAELAGQTSH